MYLRAPTSFLNALKAYAGPDQSSRAAGSLRLFRPLGPAFPQAPSEYKHDVAALIDADAQTIRIPEYLAPAWLEIPPRWLHHIAGRHIHDLSSGAHLVLAAADCSVEVHGAWVATFKALGFTENASPASGRIPTYTG